MFSEKLQTLTGALVESPEAFTDEFSLLHMDELPLWDQPWDKGIQGSSPSAPDQHPNAMEAQSTVHHILGYLLQAERCLPKKFNSATLFSSLKVKFQCIPLSKMLLFNHDFCFSGYFRLLEII